MRRPITVVLTLVLSAGALVAMPAAPALAAPVVGFDQGDLPGIVAEEDGTFTFTLKMTEAAPLADPVTVTWKVEHVTTANADFDGGEPPTDEVTFLMTDGETKTFTVPVAADSDPELDESFRVVLTGVSGGGATIDESRRRALGHVLDDDTPTVSIQTTVGAEGSPISETDAGSTKATFTLSIGDDPYIDGTGVTVTWRTVDRTATAGQDYTGFSEQTTTIEAGETEVTVEVPIIDDGVAEGSEDEHFDVELLSATRGELPSGFNARRASAFIQDDQEGGPTFVRVLEPAPFTEPASSSQTEEFEVALSAAAPTGGLEVTAEIQHGDTTDNDVTFALEVGETEPPAQRTITIGGGSTSGTFDVSVHSDDEAESTKAFQLVLLSTTTGSIPPGGGSATGTILDTDGPDVSLTGPHDSEGNAVDVAVIEGESATFRVGLPASNGTGKDIVVTWEAFDGTSSASSGDYGLTSGMVTIAKDTQSATFSIPTGDDQTDEFTESFWVRLTDPGVGDLGTDVTEPATIWDNDAAPTVRVRDAAVLEGDSGTTPMVFPLELDKPSAQDITVRWSTVETTNSDHADHDDDYVHVDVSASNTVIPAGETAGSLEVLVNGDTAFEQDETFDVVLNGDLTDGAAVPDSDDDGRRATGTIVNDDGARFVVHDASALEGASGSGGRADFVVELLGEAPFRCPTNLIGGCPSPDNPFVVQYETRDGTDERRARSTNDEFVNDPDYVHTTGELTFAPGEFEEGEPKTKTVSVPLVGDPFHEFSEWFTLEISLTNDSSNDAATIQDGSGRGTIINDDGPPLTIVGDDEPDAGAERPQIAVGESSEAALITVQMDGSPEGPVRVKWTTAALDVEDTPKAEADTDYEAASGVLEFPSGTSQASFAIPIIADQVNEPDESFLVKLSEPDFARIVDDEAVVTIVDDDGAQIDVGDVTVTEGADSIVGAVFDVTLSEPAGNVTVDYATADGTATVADKDYLAASGTLTIPAGETSATITVEVLPNPDEGPDETFTLNLSNPSGAVLGKATGTATIVDALGGGGGGGGGGEGEAGEVFRSAGEDRIATAVQVSADHWPSADAVAIATAWAFPDALAGGALAAGLRGPLLLSDQDELPQAVADEIGRLGATEAWILGGPAALGPGVEQALQEMGLDTVRLAGFDRFETAAEVARAIRLPQNGEVMLALGIHDNPNRAWPDALSAGSLAASGDQVPTLLTRPDQLPAETEEVLAELGAQRIRVLGGPAAVSDAVVQRLVDLGYDVDRLAGDTRYGTTVAVAQEALLRHPPGEVILIFATGQKFPDGLAAGALAARFRALVVLVPPDDLELAPEVRNFLAGHADRFDQGVVVGGPLAVTDDVRSQLAQAMQAG